MERLMNKKSLLLMLCLLGSNLQANSDTETYDITCQPGGKMSIDYSLWSGHNDEHDPSVSRASIKYYQVVDDVSQLVPGSCAWNKSEFNGNGREIVHFNIKNARFIVGSNNQVSLLSLGQDGNRYLRAFQAQRRFTLKAKKNTGRNFHVLSF